MYQSRRIKVIKEMKNNSLLLFYSGNEVTSSGDSTYDFEVERNFYYLTGIDEPHVYLLIHKINERKYQEILFIDAFHPLSETWFGKKITSQEAKTISGIKCIKYNAKINKNERGFPKEDKLLFDYINSIKKTSKILYINFIRKCDPLNDFIASIKINVSLEALHLVNDLRKIKSDYEVKQICKAIDITNKGLLKVVKNMKSFNYEYEAFNAFNEEILNNGDHSFGFPSIVASGINATCLHYPKPYDKMHKDGLLLLDVGASFDNYSADITRTYPISGKFSKIQKEIYEIVLKANKEVIKAIKPGVTNKEMQELTNNILAEGLIKLKIIKKKEEINKYYMHNIGHQLGLDTHDCSERGYTYQEGNVVTVEPGLYIKELKIGVRIEDDVLVTKTGNKVLSKNIVKEINEIENLFKGGKK